MSHVHADLIEQCYHAFNERDLKLLPELHDGFEVDLTNSIGFDRARYGGLEGLETFFESYWESFTSIRIDVEELHGESDDRVLAIIRATGRGVASGVEVDARGPHVWQFRSGRPAVLALYGDLTVARRAVGLE